MGPSDDQIFRFRHRRDHFERRHHDSGLTLVRAVRRRLHRLRLNRPFMCEKSPEAAARPNLAAGLNSGDLESARRAAFCQALRAFRAHGKAKPVRDALRKVLLRRRSGAKPL
jgi:hypothetical protein